jgi:hypothetical protein
VPLSAIEGLSVGQRSCMSLDEPRIEARARRFEGGRLPSKRLLGSRLAPLGARPFESQRLADAQRMPAPGKLIESVDRALESFTRHACRFELFVPVIR